MKVRILSAALVAAFSASAFAQPGSATKSLPMPSAPPVAVPAPANLIPPLPSMGATPTNAGPRNPLKPSSPTPSPTPTVMPTQQTLPAPGGMPGVGAQPGLQGMPAAPVEAAADPVKANGKRIGKLNGKAIFKLEEAYYFDSETEKHKK